MRGGGENNDIGTDNFGPFNPSRLTLPTLLDAGLILPKT